MNDAMQKMTLRIVLGCAVCLGMLASGGAEAADRADGQLRLKVVDSQTGQPIAARIHLKNSRGRPVRLRSPGIVEHGDHFYVDGEITLGLRRGQYTFEIDAGPEYRTQSGHFEIDRHADDEKTIPMNRFANLAEEGWWASDLDVQRQLVDLPVALRAEELYVVPVTTGENDHGTWKELRVISPRRTEDADSATDGRAIRPSAVLDLRQGGGLLLIDSDSNELVELAGPWLPSSSAVVRQTHAEGGHCVALTPFAWDLPLWLAGGDLDAILLVNRHALREGVVDNESDGRPRDRVIFPGLQGNGRWSEAIYYHILNCGLRIPAAAGSGSGMNDNPVGINRVYVHCGDDFSYEKWWEGLEAGRVVVTNGPLLRPLVEGHPPGYVFHMHGDQPLELEIGLNLATRTPVEYLQIIKNGQVEAEVRLSEWAGRKGRLPPIRFDKPGWFLVRAVTDNPKTYEYASSGPYWVEKDGRGRISRRNAQFFLDWLAEGRQRLSEADAEVRDAMSAEYDAAEAFWKALLARANAE